MRKILVALAGVAVLVSVTAAASALRATPAVKPAAGVTSAADVVIKHAYLGCHIWSVNGNRATASQEVTLSQGGLLTVTNLDSCQHQLLQASGPAPASMQDLATGKPSNGTLSYGAPVTLQLSTPGVYQFTTFEGPHGLTIEEKAGDAALAPDNYLLLTVTVIPHGLINGLPTAGQASID